MKDSNRHDTRRGLRGVVLDTGALSALLDGTTPVRLFYFREAPHQ